MRSFWGAFLGSAETGCEMEAERYDFEKLSIKQSFTVSMKQPIKSIQNVADDNNIFILSPRVFGGVQSDSLES